MKITSKADCLEHYKLDQEYFARLKIISKAVELPIEELVKILLKNDINWIKNCVEMGQFEQIRDSLRMPDLSLDQKTILNKLLLFDLLR